VRGSVEAPVGFQLRIELREVLPPVWRRFLVPGSITLPASSRDPGGHGVGELPPPPLPVRREGVRDSRSRVPLGDAKNNWEHDVVVERIVTGAEVTDARCLEGERACPPEDGGGPPGYMEYLEALQNPSHPDHQQMVDWRGPSFDPERFDLKRINRRLSLLSRSRRRA
jgi:Plasmid pRiA4b ORF-3-like protein